VTYFVTHRFYQQEFSNQGNMFKNLCHGSKGSNLFSEEINDEIVWILVRLDYHSGFL